MLMGIYLKEYLRGIFQKDRRPQVRRLSSKPRIKCPGIFTSRRRMRKSMDTPEDVGDAQAGLEDWGGNRILWHAEKDLGD